MLPVETEVAVVRKRRLSEQEWFSSESDSKRFKREVVRLTCEEGSEEVEVCLPPIYYELTKMLDSLLREEEHNASKCGTSMCSDSASKSADVATSELPFVQQSEEEEPVSLLSTNQNPKPPSSPTDCSCKSSAATEHPCIDVVLQQLGITSPSSTLPDFLELVSLAYPFNTCNEEPKSCGETWINAVKLLNSTSVEPRVKTKPLSPVAARTNHHLCQSSPGRFDTANQDEFNITCPSTSHDSLKESPRLESLQQNAAESPETLQTVEERPWSPQEWNPLAPLVPLSPIGDVPEVSDSSSGHLESPADPENPCAMLGSSEGPKSLGPMLSSFPACVLDDSRPPAGFTSPTGDSREDSSALKLESTTLTHQAKKNPPKRCGSIKEVTPPVPDSLVPSDVTNGTPPVNGSTVQNLELESSLDPQASSFDQKPATDGKQNLTSQPAFQNLPFNRATSCDETENANEPALKTQQNSPPPCKIRLFTCLVCRRAYPQRFLLESHRRRRGHSTGVQSSYRTKHRPY